MKNKELLKEEKSNEDFMHIPIGFIYNDPYTDKISIYPYTENIKKILTLILKEISQETINRVSGNGSI